MKKLINEPSKVVRQMLEGMVAQSPGCALLENETVVVRHPLPAPERRAVAVLSGGGSGHEPAHAGFVGAGLLTAAVAGDVFTSPSTDAVLAALQAVSGPAGAVLIVKNYTGDRLNFGLAAELARGMGIATEVVIVADDVALRDTVEKKHRRGIAGTIFVHKIAGAAAAAGMKLEEVAKLAREAASQLGSMGVALGPCTLPAVGRPGFVLNDDEVEFGLGIHGEKGVARTGIEVSSVLVDKMLDAITQDLDLKAGEQVVLLVNGLGATPFMELSIVARDALDALALKGIIVERAWTGTFLSALDMPGCSLSLLRVDDARLALLDADAQAPAWTSKGCLNQEKIIPAAAQPIRQEQLSAPLSEQSQLMRRMSLAAAAALIDSEETLTDLDMRAGDGDLGSSMARGATALRNLPESDWQTPAIALNAMGNALRRAIGGSSGAFYATALLRASRRLIDEPSPTPAAWTDAFKVAVAAIAELGGAVPGDRTMLDALYPAGEELAAALSGGKSVSEALEASAAAASIGADSSSLMRPKAGRASYLGERAVGIPDAGAAAVAVWLQALASEFKTVANQQ